MAAGLLTGTIVMIGCLAGFLAVAKRQGWLEEHVSSGYPPEAQDLS
jgi:hypothetical protein